MEKKEVLDGGWGWMVVLGCSTIFLMFGFVFRGFGILYLMLLEKFDGSPVDTSWIGTALLLAWGLTGPISGFLIKRFSCRSVTMFGVLLVTSGIISTGFAPSLFATYFTYSLTGCGISLGFNASLYCVGLYFSSKKSLALGLGVMGSAVGTIICPPTLQYFFKNYGFSGGMLMFSCIALQGFVAASMFYPIKKMNQQPNGLREAKTNPSDSNKCTTSQHLNSAEGHCGEKSKLGEDEGRQTCGKITRYLQLFIDPLLISVLLMSFSIFSMYYIFSMVPALGVQNGVHGSDSSYLVTANAAFDAFVKLLVSPLFDWRKLRNVRPVIYAVLGILSGSTIALLPLCHSFFSLVVMSSLFGIVNGGVGGHRQTIIMDLMDQDKLPDAMGLSVLFGSLGSFLTSLYLGVILDYTGSLDVCFYTSGIITVVSFFTLLILSNGVYKDKVRRKRDEITQMDVST